MASTASEGPERAGEMAEALRLRLGADAGHFEPTDIAPYCRDWHGDVQGAAVAVLSALQFRGVVRGLGEKEVPRGYWTQLGVWLNFLLAAVALALAVHFVLTE